MTTVSPPRPLLVLTAALAVLPAAVRADDLDQQLLAEAPKLLKLFQERGFQNVGVLKFRVQKDKEKARANVGTLNLELAHRLEKALIVRDNASKPIGIIQDASAVAARTPGANHLTPEGRQKLFQARYPLAWAGEPVAADAFLTGVAQLSPDLRRLTVQVLLYDKAKEGVEKIGEVAAKVSPGVLTGAGESFRLRGVLDSGNEELVEEKTSQMAARVRTQAATFPLQEKDAPIALEIYYDDKRVPIEFTGGMARVAEPREGQKVHFVLKRQDDSKEKYGVVLKVNGENTLYRQRLRDEDCSKWILGPGAKPATIRGYQMDGDKAQAFRVLSTPESKAREMDYGADVGMISVVVFREQTGKEKAPPPPGDDDEELAVIARGIYPAEKPKSLGALKQQLKKDSTRGLIGEGEETGSKVQKVTFKADPTPELTAAISYYRP